MAEHLQGGAGQAYLAQGEDAQQHIAHVADAAVGDQPLDVGLPQGDGGAVEHADDGQDNQQQGVVAGDVREEC